MIFWLKNFLRTKIKVWKKTVKQKMFLGYKKHVVVPFQ